MSTQTRQCCNICKNWDREHRVRKPNTTETFAKCLAMEYPLVYGQWDGNDCDDFELLKTEKVRTK